MSDAEGSRSADVRFRTLAFEDDGVQAGKVTPWYRPRATFVQAGVRPESDAAGQASEARSASTTRSWSARSRRAWNGSAIVRLEQSSLTGSIPSENP